MVRYALGPEDKEARRDTILAAARTLFLAGGGTLPSAAHIAAAAGLAKGTVYLYFRTKEEIFAALLIAEWGALLDEVDAAFAPGPGAVADTVAAFLARYVRHVERRPELLRLDALGYAVLEKNLGPDELRAFKLAFVEWLNRAGAVVDARLALPAGRGLELLMRTYALTRGLWQMLDYSGDAAALMAEPALAPMRPDFRSALVQALDEYWRGALAPAVTLDPDGPRDPDGTRQPRPGQLDQRARAVRERRDGLRATAPVAARASDPHTDAPG